MIRPPGKPGIAIYSDTPCTWDGVGEKKNNWRGLGFLVLLGLLDHIIGGVPGLTAPGDGGGQRRGAGLGLAAAGVLGARRAVHLRPSVWSRKSHTVDEIHFAPPKKPWKDDSPANTNKQ